MEVLRFTEGLEQKIQADGEAKVQQIVSDGERECQRILRDFEARFASFESEKRAETESKIDALRRDVQSELALKQDRLQFSFKSSSVLSGINEYLGALPQDRLLQLLERKLNDYKQVLAGRQLVAKIVDMDTSLVEPLLLKVFGKNVLQSCLPTDPFPLGEAFLGYDDAETSNLYRGVVLETTDGSIRCRATLGEVVAPLLENHREEMMRTLFGEGISV